MILEYGRMFCSGVVHPPTVVVPPPPAANAPFTLELLGHISRCIERILGISAEDVNLRLSLLSNRARSELLHAMIVCADTMVERYQVADEAGRTAVEGWGQLRERFMCMLDN